MTITLFSTPFPPAFKLVLLYVAGLNLRDYIIDSLQQFLFMLRDFAFEGENVCLVSRVPYGRNFES